MRPNFLTSCLKDIEALRGYHAGFSAVTAQCFVDTVFAKVEQLEDFPELGRMVPELQNPTMRELIYPSTALFIGCGREAVLTFYLCKRACAP